ncbi:efflux RND transporter permease subunit, partial [Candidatus Entotheonella palauensis]|uniref:efflux RND transporter permease subunit n=1 Tax=Candidatus Entotheonella palauensis TaxID=93172 RepID=UPI000B7D4D8C
MDSLRHRIAHLILSRPGLFLLFSCGLVLALAPGLSWLIMDFGIRIWLSQDHALMAPLDRFEKNFGNDEAVVVAVSDTNGLFTPRTIQLIQDLTDHLERIDDVQRVDSLTNHQMVYGSEEAITVEVFIPEAQDLGPSQLAAKRAKALQDEVMVGYLLDPHARTTLLYAWLQPSLERDPNYRQIVHDVRQSLAPYQDWPGLTLHITGAGALNDAFRSASEKDVTIVFPLLAGVICLILWGLYRRLTVVALPLLLIFMTNLIIFGLLGYAGIALNNMLSVIPLIIVAIAIADSIHVINDMARHTRDGLGREPALRRAAEDNLLPTALTSVTTAIGFTGLLSTPIVPIQQLALTAALASLMAWALTFTFVVPLLRLLPIGWTTAPPKPHRGDRFDRFLQGYSRFLEAYRYRILIAGLLVAVAGVYVTAQVRIDSEPNAYFADNVPIKRANDFVNREIGGFNGPEIVLDSGSPGGAKEPAFLRKVEVLETWIDSHPYVNQTISIVDILKSVHRAFHADDPQFYALASSPDVIAQELFVYSMGLSEGRSLD